MKISPLGAELFHVDGLTNVIVAFHSFARAPKSNYLTKYNSPGLHIHNFVYALFNIKIYRVEHTRNSHKQILYEDLFSE
jgi:hypothetical protein